MNKIRIHEEKKIILKIKENPRRSIHSISNQMRISYSKIQRVLRDEGMHPYHFTSSSSSNVIWNFVGSYCFTQQRQYILNTEFYSPLSLYERDYLTQFALSGKRKSLRNQRKKLLSSMEVKELGRNHRRSSIEPYVLPNRMRGDDYTNFFIGNTN